MAQRGSPTVRMALAGLAGVGISFGFARYGYGLFLPAMQAEFELSVAQLGLIGSATYVGYLLALVLVGAFATQIGPRWLVGIGGLSATFGTALVGLASGPVTLSAGLILAGTSPGWIWASYSDAVDRTLPRHRRETVLALIPAGTAIGVVLAGPLALLATGPAWRAAWLVFAVLSLAATLYNLRILPGAANPRPRHRPRSERAQLRWLARPSALPLYLTALSYGLVGSVYWLLAVTAVAAATGTGDTTAAWFWTMIGAAGIAGVGSGAALTRLGLPRTHCVIFGSLAIAVALLAVAPGWWFTVAASALLYGPAFMAGSALLAVWSYRVFPERPTTGFSATVFFLALGTIAGPATLGTVADQHGLSTALLVAAVVALLTLPVRPTTVSNGDQGRPAGAELAAAPTGAPASTTGHPAGAEVRQT